MGRMPRLEKTSFMSGGGDILGGGRLALFVLLSEKLRKRQII